MKKTLLVLGFIAIAPFMASVCYAQSCLFCHPSGQPPDPPGQMNCLASGCHESFNNGNHHTTALALAGTCTACHDPNLVADYDEENPLSSEPNDLTPTVQSCNNCHKGHANPVDQNGNPYSSPIDNTAVLEHMAGQGYTISCLLCHPADPPGDPAPIRQCETCHTVDTLHNIAGHAVTFPDPLPYDGFWYDENGVWTEITNNDRCIACHGAPPDPAPDTMLYVSQDVGTYDTTYSQLDEDDCRSCHGGSTAERHHQATGAYSHDTHQTKPRGPQLGEGADSCLVCHGPGPWDSEHWADSATSLATTGVCDVCHSPGGAYDGVNDSVIGAKHNWTDAGSAIYNVTEDALLAGKEDWCAGCHDNVPANSRESGSGVDAPNVMGDNMVYGYNISGHGRSSTSLPDGLTCEGCHDLQHMHIDHSARTYSALLDNYSDGYRLNANLDVPRLNDTPGQYLLCMQCHADVFETSNFKQDVTQVIFLHPTMLQFLTLAWDSDVDLTADSAMTCPTCHNAHGSPMDVGGSLEANRVMIRHGELTDSVPGLDFHWYTEPFCSSGTGQQTFDRDASRSGQVYTNGPSCAFQPCHVMAPCYSRTLVSSGPVIDQIGNRKCYPGEKIRIIGSGFGEEQGDSVVHIKNITYGSTSTRIKLWTDALIKVKIPFAGKDCSWFNQGGGEYRKRKVWVTVEGVDSNTKKIRVLKPDTCP